MIKWLVVQEEEPPKRFGLIWQDGDEYFLVATGIHNHQTARDMAEVLNKHESLRPINGTMQ